MQSSAQSCNFVEAQQLIAGLGCSLPFFVFVDDVSKLEADRIEEPIVLLSADFPPTQDLLDDVGTAIGPRFLIGQAGHCEDELLGLLGGSPPHVTSIALGVGPTSAELNLASELGHLLRRQYGAFVVVTSALADPETVIRLGQACDCFIGSNGSPIHHHYPVRTVSEPASGRLVCYDLYDACCIWAGRLGEYGVFRPAADALHVEISAAVTTLQEVDELAADYRSHLNDPDNLKLFNVVDGVGWVDATPSSFWRSPLIRQDRAPELT